MATEQKAKSLALPIFVITIGTGWFLNSLDVIPDVNWVWTGGLAAVGVLVLVANGLNRVTVVIGPFFITASMFSMLRQTGQIVIGIEMACLVITFGVLMLVSQLSRLPAPGWILDDT